LGLKYHSVKTQQYTCFGYK